MPGANTKYWFAASTEEFTPSQMLEQARVAEEVGFDGLGASDHFAPWFPEGQAAQVSDEEFAGEGFLVGSDVDAHVDSIREMESAGATVICLQLIGAADPLSTIRTYGERVLPALRGASVS